MNIEQQITARDYAIKMVDAAYYEVLPNKETIKNVFEALIKEYADQKAKLLTEQFEDVKRQNLELQEQLAEKEKELSEVKKYINDSILSCDIMIEKFEQSKMETSKLCSESMKQAYFNVLNKLTQPINNQ